MLKIGDNIFYTPYGLAEVMSIEKRDFGDHVEDFYVINLETGGSLLLPVENSDKCYTRPLISKAQAKKCMDVFKELPTEEESSNWKERASKYNEYLDTGLSEKYTSVLRVLMHRSKNEKLSLTEEKILGRARKYFFSELSTVLNLPVKSIQENLNLNIDNAS